MLKLTLCCVFIVWFTNVEADCPPIVVKKEWDALKPEHVQYLTTPVDLVIIQHTVTQSCSNDQSCAEVVRDLQKTHIEKSFLWDIGPSFLIGGTGKVYEGRGWNHVAVHTYGYNNQSFGIAFIGSFNNQEPSDKALDAARALIRCGVEEERISADHTVVIHNQLLNTESPGHKLASKVKSWPDWKEDVSEIKKRADGEQLRQVPPEEDQKKAKQHGDNDLVLATPKHIDLLTNTRDTLAQLINNLRDLALQTLTTVEDFTRGVDNQAALFFEKITSGLKSLKDKFSSAINTVSGVPGVGKCVNPIKEKANALYDNTDAKARACADQRLKELNDMIKNLGDLSSDTIQFTNTAVAETKNCTELNLGVQAPTKACLDSVTQKTQSASGIYEKQKNLSLNSIQTSVQALPAALDLCAKKYLLEASSETTKLTTSVTSCPTKGIGGALNPFG